MRTRVSTEVEKGMAEFNARWEELEKGILEAEAKDYDQLKDKSDDPKSTLPITTRASGLSKNLSAYMDWRDRALNDSLDILKEESTSVTATGQREKWSDYFSKKGQEALKMITDYVKDYEKVAPNLRKFGELVAAQESSFFAKIGTAPIAWFQGQVQEYTHEFYREMNSLEDKWKRLGDGNRSFHEKVESISKDIQRVYDEVVKEMISNQRDFEKKMSSPSAPVTKFGAVMMIIKLAVNAQLALVEKYKKTNERYASELAQLSRSNNTTVVIITQIREAVREFLKNTNLNSAVHEFNETKNNSLQVAGQCPTPKQQEDAKKFINKAIPEVEEFMDDFKKEYEEFVSDNRGIFVGPVASSTLEQVLEVDGRKKAWDDVQRINIQTKLQEIYNDSRTIFESDLDDIKGMIEVDGKELTYEEALKNYWKEEIGRLSEGIVAASNDTAWDRIKKFYTREPLDLASVLQSSKGGEE